MGDVVSLRPSANGAYVAPKALTIGQKMVALSRRKLAADSVCGVVRLVFKTEAEALEFMGLLIAAGHRRRWRLKKRPA